MKKTIRYIVLIFALCHLGVRSQNESSKWYFGNWMGLDFMTNPPTLLFNGAMATNEGCSTVADAAGNLLFYTDGITVWNQTHVMMANGNALLGNSSTTQSALIVKKPGSSNLYYIFTLAVLGASPSFHYSVVDMTLAAGMGSVTIKNSLVYGGLSTEKITAVRHCNGIDFWIITHEGSLFSNTFKTYLLSSAGLNLVPVLSNTGSFGVLTGTLRSSFNGRMLCSSTNAGTTDECDLFDFDPATGQVSYRYSIDTGTNLYSYGSEFSPDGTKLYVACYTGLPPQTSKIFQYNLCAGSQTAVVASQYSVAASSIMAAMQIAPNGKIYCARAGGMSIGVINNPNVSGAGCNYADAGQPFMPGTCNLGLPNLALAYKPTYVFTNTLSCLSASFTPPYTPNTYTTLSCSSSGYSLTGMAWNFGDPSSGVSNTSTATNPTHIFSGPGTYTTTLILYFTCGAASDTIRSVLNVNNQCFSFQTNSISCGSLGSATVTSQSGGPYSYTWTPTAQTGSVANNLSPGSYTLFIFNQANNSTFSITTTFTPQSSLSATIANTSTLNCNGASTGTAMYTGVTGGSAAQTYSWTSSTSSYSSATSPSVTVLTAGQWTATITDALTGCQVTSTFFISQPPAITVAITASSASACIGSPITFTGNASGGSAGYSYSWTTGTAGSVCSVSQNTSGTYVYTLNILDANNCVKSNTVSVFFAGNPPLTVNNPTICPFESTTLSVSGANSYTWNTGSNNSSIIVSPSITTQYTVTGFAGCSSTETVTVDVKSSPNVTISSNSGICSGQTLTLSCSTGTAYVWSGPNSFTSATAGNTINPGLFNIHDGVYNVTVTAANSCTSAGSTTIVIKPLPSLTISPSSSSICINTNSINLSASGTATLYSWSPTSGLSSATASNVNAGPSSTQAYTLTGSLNGCTTIATATVNVVSPPSLTLSLSSSSLCAQALNGSPNSIILNASGANTYTLVTPNHLSNISPGGPSYTLGIVPPYQPVGLSTATLYGSNSACSVSTTAMFTIVPNPTVAINATTPTICVGETYTWSGSGAITYTWSSSTPGSTILTTGNNIVNSPGMTSIFSVYGGSLGCNSASQSTTITVNQPPLVSVSPNPAFVCLGSSVMLQALGNGASFSWTPPAPALSANSQSVIASPLTSQVYIVTASLNNCTAAAVAVVSVVPLPTVNISAERTRLCLNETIHLQAFGASNYLWLLPNNTSLKGQDISQVLNNLGYSGTYTLVGTDGYGCTAQSQINVHVDNLPAGILQSSSPANCAPFCSDFRFIPNGALLSQKWQISGQEYSANIFSSCFPVAGEYLLKGFVKDLNNCVNTLTYVVNAYPRPEADFNYHPLRPVEKLDEVVFENTSNGKNNTTFNWYFINNEGYRSENERCSYTFENYGQYPVALVVKNVWGCADSSIKIVNVEEDFEFFVPNTFTPNEDDRNEIFKPVVLGVKQYSLMIFNRWGQLVFSTENVYQGWDGFYHGQPCPQDVYVWKISLSTRRGFNRQYNGHVTLYR